MKTHSDDTITEKQTYSKETAERLFKEYEERFEEKQLQEGAAMFICPAYNAGEFIVPTIERLQRQIEASQLTKATILVVIDNNGGDTEEALDKLSRTGANVTNIGTEKTLPVSADKVNIIIARHFGKQGKRYALKHAYELLFGISDFYPEWTFLFDAETRIYGPEEYSPIDLLIHTSVRTDGLVTGKDFLTRYSDGDPDFQNPVKNPTIRLINHNNLKRPDPNFLYGGLIVGSTRQLVPLSSTALDMLPEGNPAEDYMTTIVSRSLKIPYCTEEAIQFTNYIPDDPEAMVRQLKRWTQSSQHLEKNLGPIIATRVPFTERVRKVIRYEFTDLQSMLNFLHLYARNLLYLRAIRKRKGNYVADFWSHKE